MEMHEKFVINDDSIPLKCFQMLNYFRETGELCDIVFKTDDGMSIQAHKVVLSASSVYFQSMFTSNFLESSSSVIDLKNVNGDALNDLVNYFYTGKLCVHHLNVIGIIELCHALKIDTLIDKCEVFLRRNLSTRNSLGLQAFGQHYSLSGLKEHAMRFSCWYFNSIKEEEEFFSLPQKELKQLISHDSLKAPSEEYILEAAIKWLAYDLENRKAEFEDLLKQIRFPLMSHKYLSESEVVKYVMENFPESQDLIFQALEFQSNQLIPEINDLKKFSPRSASEDIFVIGGWSNGQKLSTVQCFNVDTLQWTNVNNMNVARVAKEHYFRVIVCNDELYTICFDKVMKYDPILSTWNKVADGPEIRCKWAGVCEYDSGFYVIGGSRSKISKRFNVQKGIWEELPPSFLARSVKFQFCQSFYEF